MTKKIQILFLFLLLTYNLTYGQKTPQELGHIVFDVLKNKKFSALDTLTPKPTNIIEIFARKYQDARTDTSDRFLEKYVHHDKIFKKKCQRIRNDTTELKIQWLTASLTKVEYSEIPYPYQDTAKTSKKIQMNFLTLHILSDTSTYVLEFKEIYFHKGIWKLGESVRVRRP